MNSNVMSGFDPSLLDPKCKLQRDQVEWMFETAGELMLRRLLIFGAQHPLVWAGAGHPTFLLYHVRTYRRLFEKDAHQSLRAYLLYTRSKVRNWESDLESQAMDTMPPEVARTDYDVVLIAGPKGHSQSSPGRVSSILWAKRLLKKEGIIFLNDYERELEKEVSLRALGEPDEVHRGRTAIACWKL